MRDAIDFPSFRSLSSWRPKSLLYPLSLPPLLVGWLQATGCDLFSRPVGFKAEGGIHKTEECLTLSFTNGLNRDSYRRQRS